MKQTDSYKTLLLWVASVLLIAAGLYQAVSVLAWGAVSDRQLIAQLQQQYVPQQAQLLVQQLEPLAQAAQVQLPEQQQLESRLNAAVDIAITGKEIAQLPMAGTEMKQQVQQQLEQSGIEATQEIAALMDTLEQEGNRLEQQAWQLPAAQQLQALCEQAKQQAQLVPFGVIAVALTLAGCVVLLVQRKMQPFFCGLAAAGLMACLMLRIGFMRLQAPVLAQGQNAAEQALNSAVEQWAAQVKTVAEQGALAVGVGALICALIAAACTLFKKKSQ